MPDRGQDVLELAALGPGVVDVVGDDHGQPQLVGQARRLRDEPVVVGQQVVLELEHEAAPRPPSSPRPNRPAYRSATARAPSRSPARSRRASSPSRQPDSAISPSACSASSAWREPRHGLRPGEVRPRHQPAQAPPARRVPGEQHEVRPALPLADPAVVLLHDRAMTRQPGTGRAGPGGPALGASTRRLGDATGGRRPGSPGARGGPATTIPPGSGTAGVDQLDLDPDHRAQPGRLGGGREPDRAVQALVVRDRRARPARAPRPARRGRPGPRPRRGTRSGCGSAARRRRDGPRDGSPGGGPTG